MGDDLFGRDDPAGAPDDDCLTNNSGDNDDIPPPAGTSTGMGVSWVGCQTAADCTTPTSPCYSVACTVSGTNGSCTYVGVGSTSGDPFDAADECVMDTLEPETGGEGE